MPDKDYEGRQGASNEGGQRKNRGPQGVRGGSYREGQGIRSQGKSRSYMDQRDRGGVSEDRTGGRQGRNCQSEGPRKSADGVREGIPADRYTLTAHEGPLPQPRPVVPYSPPKPSSDRAGASAITSGTKTDALVHGYIDKYFIHM